MISYTRNFEDVMLVRALGHVQQGFYVDVDASHPVDDSNPYALYGKGWRGIAIEPQPIFNELWQSLRPEDGLINAAVAATAGEATLFKPVVYGQGATINPSFARDYAQRGLAMTEAVVPVHTLTQMLTQFRPEGEIHLLSIDVEGAEEGTLRGLDLQRFRPWLIVLESVLPGQPTPHFAHWEPMLLEADYEFVYFDAVNRFYVAKEHPVLKAHFNHPPCVWDDFVGHELQSLLEQKEKLTTAAKDSLHNPIPFGLSLSKSLISLNQPFDRLRANGVMQTFPKWMLASAMRFKEAGDTAAFESLLVSNFELVPSYEEAHWPIEGWLVGQARRAEALAFYQQAVQHAPNSFYNHHNLGMLLRWEKRFVESEAAFKRMMAINPSFSEGRMNYGALLLALGRYDEGWALFEARYLVSEGEPLQGKSIMLMREQGYGDELMFVRFAQNLKERGAANVAVLCQAPIKTLLQTLPHALGITWRGSPTHGNDHNRSLASLAVLRPLWDVPKSLLSACKQAKRRRRQAINRYTSGAHK